MSAVHKLQHSGEASGDGCVLKVCQKQICQSALPFSVSEVTPVTPSSLSIYCPPSAPLHTHIHTLYFLCGHLLFSILSPPFLLFIQHLICHTLTANLISFFLTFSPSFLLFPSPFSPRLLLADFSIHGLSCSFDFSSLTLLISFRAPPFSLTYCFSLCLSRSPRWSRW